MWLAETEIGQCGRVERRGEARGREVGWWRLVWGLEEAQRSIGGVWGGAGRQREGGDGWEKVGRYEEAYWRAEEKWRAYGGLLVDGRVCGDKVGGSV